MRPRFADYFDYNPDTGILTWAINKGTRVRAGQMAGCLNKHGYLIVKVDYQIHYVHRVIWEILYGPCDDIIDHANGIKTDNRQCNLRKASYTDNNRNSVVTVRNRTTGIKGLCISRGRYYARCSGEGKRFPLTEEGKAAALDWLAEQRKSHGEFANDGGTP